MASFRFLITKIEINVEQVVLVLVLVSLGIDNSLTLVTNIMMISHILILSI